MLRQALRLGPGDTAVCISSGCDNALALLLDNPRMVLAVDYSPAQVAVGELKRQAIKSLDHGTFLYFLGVKTTEEQTMSRREIYLSVLQEHLPEKAKIFWDAHLDFVDQGIIHVGIYERYLGTFGRAVVPLVHSQQTIRKLLEQSDQKRQAEFFVNVINTRLWRFFTRLYFGDVFVGRCPAFYERSNVDVGSHFRSRLNQVIRDVPVRDNYYLEYVLTGQVTGQFGLPEYMQPQNFTLLKERVGQLTLLHGDILHILENSQLQFDAIDMSNIFDFVPMFTHERYRKAAMDRARPGCRICHWTFIPVSEDRISWRSFGKGSHVDVRASEELHSIERAWFYQSFIIQRIKSYEAGELDERPAKNGTTLPVRKNGVHLNGVIGH